MVCNTECAVILGIVRYSIVMELNIALVKRTVEVQHLLEKVPTEYVQKQVSNPYVK